MRRHWAVIDDGATTLRPWKNGQPPKSQPPKSSTTKKANYQKGQLPKSQLKKGQPMPFGHLMFWLTVSWLQVLVDFILSISTGWLFGNRFFGSWLFLLASYSIMTFVTTFAIAENAYTLVINAWCFKKVFEENSLCSFYKSKFGRQAIDLSCTPL